MVAAKRRAGVEMIEASRYTLQHSLPQVVTSLPDLEVGDEVEVLHLDHETGDVIWAKGTIEKCLSRQETLGHTRVTTRDLFEGAAEEKGDGLSDLPESLAKRNSSNSSSLTAQIAASHADDERMYEVFFELEDGSFMHYPL